jgi:hypothetical protein
MQYPQIKITVINVQNAVSADKDYGDKCTHLQHIDTPCTHLQHIDTHACHL